MMTWEEICADPLLAQWPFRVESDQWGNAVLSPPPGFSHSSYQFEIGYQLRALLPEGRTLSECPIRTGAGVKATDVAWGSRKWLEKQPLTTGPCAVAPEICVEVLSPSNTKAEIHAKFVLYFAKGAKECWSCDKKGGMKFFKRAERISRSEICPAFPLKISFAV